MKLESVISAVTTAAVMVSTVTTWFLDRLPPLAALVTILWVIFQWYHSAPMVERRRRARAKRAAALAEAARIAAMEAQDDLA